MLSSVCLEKQIDFGDDWRCVRGFDFFDSDFRNQRKCPVRGVGLQAILIGLPVHLEQFDTRIKEIG